MRFRVRSKKVVDRGRYTEIFTDDVASALADYEDVVRRSNHGRYECRDCGKFFDTIEGCEVHWRKKHYQSQEVSVPM